MGTNFLLARCIDISEAIARNEAMAAINAGQIDAVLGEIGFDELEYTAAQSVCGIDVLAIEGDDYTGAARTIAIEALDEIVYDVNGRRGDIAGLGDHHLYAGGMDDGALDAYALVSLIGWFDQALLDACRRPHPNLGAHLAQTATGIAGRADLNADDVAIAIHSENDTTPHPEGTVLACPDCGETHGLRMHTLTNAQSDVDLAVVNAEGRIEPDWSGDTDYYTALSTGMWSCGYCAWHSTSDDLVPAAE